MNPEVVILTASGPQMAVLTYAVQAAGNRAFTQVQMLDEHDSFLSQALFLALEDENKQGFPAIANLKEFTNALGLVLIRLRSLTTIRTDPIDKHVISKMGVQFERRRDQLQLVLPREDADVVKKILEIMVNIPIIIEETDIYKVLKHFLSQFP